MIEGTLDGTNKEAADELLAIASAIRGRNRGGIGRKAGSIVVNAQSYVDLIARRPVPTLESASASRVRVQRGDKQKLVASLLRRAGIAEPAPIKAGTFAGEPIIVLHGRHESSLAMYNQHGKQIGTAERSRGRYSRDGYRYRYEVFGLGPTFIVTDVSEGRFLVTPRDFTIVGVDGTLLASASRGRLDNRSHSSQDIGREPPWRSFVFERDGETVATLREMPRKEFRRTRARVSAANPIESLRMRYDRFSDSRLFYVDDQSRQQAARITYLPASGVGYVLELQPDMQELLAVISVAACLIADNAFVPQSGGGGN